MDLNKKNMKRIALLIAFGLLLYWGPVSYTHLDVYKRQEDEVVIQVTLTSGSATCSCWGCDLTYDYVKINGDYRS